MGRDALSSEQQDISKIQLPLTVFSKGIKLIQRYRQCRRERLTWYIVSRSEVQKEKASTRVELTRVDSF